MEQVRFSLPAMWADHHVLAVREALGKVGGVQEVVASSLSKDVLVKFEPTTVTPDALAHTLVEAGFEIGQGPDLPAYPKRIEDASDWFKFQERITITDMRDLEMSGDFRKY
jgi:copper chaperone CopZ